MTAYVQTISEKLSSTDSAVLAMHTVNQEKVKAMVALLSYNLKAVTSYSFTSEITNSADIQEAGEIDPSTEKHKSNAIATSTGCLRDSTGAHTERGGLSSAKQQLQLVDSIMHTVSILMLVRKSTLPKHNSFSVIFVSHFITILFHFFRSLF